MRQTSLAVVCLVVLLAPARGEDDGAMVERIFDLGRLTRRIAATPYGPFGTGWTGSETPEFEGDEPIEILFIEEVHELIWATIDPESWDAEDARCDSVGTRLYVRNHPKAVAAVAALLEELEARLHRPIETHVRWMTFSPASARRLRADGLLTRAASGSLEKGDVRTLIAEALRGHGNTLESGSTSGVSGLRVAVRKLKLTAFIADYDVEVAQAARIADPSVATARAGLQVYVTPHLGLDDAITLDVMASIGRLARPMKKIAIEARTHGRIDLPRLEQAHVAANGRLVSGRTLAVPIARPFGPAGTALGVLLIGARAAPLSTTGRGLAVFNLGYLVHPAPAVQFGWSSDDAPYERELIGPRPLLFEWDEDLADGDTILSTLREAVGAGAWERARSKALVTSHGRLIVRKDADVIARMRPTIAAWESAHRRTDQIDVRVYSVPRDVAASISSGPRSDAATRKKLEASADVVERFGTSIGSFRGRWAVVAAGVEQSYVRDYDVEVASDDSAVADPHVGRFFEGAALHARARPSADEAFMSIEFDLKIEWVDPASLTTASRRGDPKLGIFQQPRSRLLHLQQAVSFPRGGLALIDGGSDPLVADGSHRLIVVVGAR